MYTITHMHPDGYTVERTFDSYDKADAAMRRIETRESKDKRTVIVEADEITSVSVHGIWHNWKLR